MSPNIGSYTSFGQVGASFNTPHERLLVAGILDRSSSNCLQSLLRTKEFRFPALSFDETAIFDFAFWLPFIKQVFLSFEKI
jgi:hypothetical protein